MSDLIVNLTDSTLDATLKNDPLPILLDLWAPWCAPCLAIAPLLEKVAADTVGRLTVAKLNVEEYEHLLPRFRVRGIPTLLLLRNGSEVSRKVGVDSLSDLNTWLRSQDIAVEAEGETVRPAAWPWPSFYQDNALFAFLTGQLQAKALAGEVSHYAFPRTEGLMTAPYVLAGQESLEIFERVTALPSPLALLLEYCDYHTQPQVDALVAALAPGKDYSLLPLRLLTFWLGDDSLPWQHELEAPVAALRQRWLTLVGDYLTAQPTPRQSWLDLEQQASELYHQCQPDRQFEMHFCTLIAMLSPPPATDDIGIIESAINTLFECQIWLEKVKAGWSREDLAMADRRWAWIEPQLSEDIPEDKAEETVVLLRARWSQEAPEFARFTAKEDAFTAAFPALLTQLTQPFRTHLLHLLQQAPDAQ